MPYRRHHIPPPFPHRSTFLFIATVLPTRDICLDSYTKCSITTSPSTHPRFLQVKETNPPLEKKIAAAFAPTRLSIPSQKIGRKMRYICFTSLTKTSFTLFE